MATKHTIIYGDSRNMSLAPNESKRNSIGYEINQIFQRFYEEKVVLSNMIKVTQSKRKSIFILLHFVKLKKK